MDRKFTDLTINPFEDNIVFEPREAEPAVIGLNEPPLQQLLTQFALLEAEPPPRRRPLRLKAQLVSSAEPGYGKSHMVGRLFKALEQRATLIYLRPFQDARSSWRSILLKLVQELHRPGGATVSHAPEAATQLDAFAAGVLSGLLLGLIEGGKLGGQTVVYWAEHLRRDPLQTLGFIASHHPELSMADWLRGRLTEGPLLPALERQLGETGIVLHAPAGAWLRVLFAYGAGRKHGPERAAALQWLKGEGLAEDEAASVGLRPFEAASMAETSAAGRNEDSWRRVQDFCALAGFYRPFLLCFDQTELFTGDPALAAEFGAVIENFVNYGLNHLIVVTTNLAPWRNSILPHVQTALHARFSSPLELTGINLDQARALAQRRLEDCQLGEGEISRFFDPPWLENYFKDSPTESVRRFLDRCKLRAAQLGGGSPLQPLPNISEYFERCLQGFEAKSPPPGFDPDVLQWAVGPEIVGGAIDGGVAERYNDPKGYTRIRWRRPLPEPERQILFGFEDSSDGRHWARILDHVIFYAAQQAAQEVRVRFVFLRTPEQPELPKPSWPAVGPKFKQAASEGLLTLQVMEHAQWSALLAAHELYTHVTEGNTPFFREETLRFVRAQLAAWWESLIRRAPAPSLPGAPESFAEPSIEAASETGADDAVANEDAASKASLLLDPPAAPSLPNPLA